MSDSEERSDKVGSLLEQDPRIPMAAERTFLAWIRTGLALMGFGFVVARFGLFLREIASFQSQDIPATGGYSVWIGITLVALGVVVNVLAAINHSRYLHALATNRNPQHVNTLLGNVVAVALAAIGIVTVVYLLAIR